MKGILVLTRTIGDVVLGNVLVKNIKLKYPSIVLDYVVNSPYYPLVRDNPKINKIIVTDNWDEVLEKMVSRGYEKVFFAQQTNPWDNCWHQIEEHRNEHLLDFYAKRCGIGIADRKLELFVKDYKKIDVGEGRCIAIHTKTLANVKDWSKFQDLVDIIKMRTNFKVVQFYCNFGEELIGVIPIKENLTNIMGFFNDKRCDLFIGLDSGLSYIASAFDIRSLIIMGATIPITSGPYGENVVNLVADDVQLCKDERKGIRCHGIERGECRFKSKCIDRITSEEVAELAIRILKGEE